MWRINCDAYTTPSYNYATGIDADVSRLSEIADDDLDNASRTQYAVYSYLGSGTIVKVEHPGVNGGLVLDYGAKGTVGWDQFGRVMTQSWTDDADTNTFDEYKYDYDRASNRVYRENTLEDGFDELYNYDGLGRLEDYARGDLNGTHDGMTSTATQQEWTLDQFGNWSGFSIDHQADGFDDPGDLNQTRDHNNANEIGTISETYGDSWLDPGYDAAGNTIHVARPGDEADANDALVLVYDAWNRLAASFDDDNANGVPDANESIIREYEYDGQGRMISWTLDGCLPIENYYSDAWQIVETRYDYDTYGHSYLQYVWDERYVDAPVVRYQDINMDGDYNDSNDSVLYYTTDANFNVTALVNTQGNMPMERYAYDPYGNVQVLNWDWAADGNNSSDVDNTRLYAGYEYEEYTGLYHVRNRAYHPTLGRWVQRDSIGYADGMNLYQYVGGGPTSHVDTTGLWTVYRHGQRGANAHANDNDTIRSLASIVKLNSSEYRKWVRFNDDTIPTEQGDKTLQEIQLDTKLCFGASVSVPNTAYIDVADYTYGLTAIYLRLVKTGIQGEYISEGLRVVYTGESDTTKNTIIRHMTSNNLYKYTYIGHGLHGQLIGINPRHEKSVTAHSYTKYGIAGMDLIACESNAFAWQWAKNVSKDGWLTTVKGKLNAYVAEYRSRKGSRE